MKPSQTVYCYWTLVYLLERVWVVFALRIRDAFKEHRMKGWRELGDLVGFSRSSLELEELEKNVVQKRARN